MFSVLFALLIPMFTWSQNGAILIESGGGDPIVAKPSKPFAADTATKASKLDNEEVDDSSQDYISRYKSNYFISGDPDTKIQFSFKYQLLRTYGLFFGYRQLIFWELFDKSRPIAEVNFNPELFYRIPFESSVFDFLQIGFWSHESNGRDFDDSRSIDKYYLQLNAKYKMESTTFDWSGQVYTFSNPDPGSRNIREYLGYGEMTFGISNFAHQFLDESKFYIRFFTGEFFDKGGREVGAECRLFWGEFTPLFYLQYYDGYGESHSRMGQYERALRAGFAF